MAQKPSSSVLPVLMLSGLVPFAAPAVAMVVWREDIALLNTAGLWMLVYAAVILSFLGGVRWGAEIAAQAAPRWRVLAPSVLGALIGWLLVMAGFRFGLQGWVFAAMAAALSLHYAFDLYAKDLPEAYRRLRIWPTLGAVLSLAVGYVLLGRA